MTSTKKTFQSIQRRSQEVNVEQADFNAVFTSAKTVIIVLTAREACFISSVFPLKKQRKRYGAIKWEKLKEKTAFVLLKRRKYVTHTLIMRMSVLKVPGGSRWKLMEDAKPIKDNFSTPRMKRKPPLFRCKELKPKRLRFGEKNECSSVCHQPKSLFQISLLVVKASTSAVRRENIRLKTELKLKMN